MAQTLQEFRAKFAFDPAKAGCIGLEREHFLKRSDQRYAPAAPRFLRRIRDSRWTYELSACQVESRVGPHRDLAALEHELLENQNRGTAVARALGLRLVNEPLAAVSLPLDLYPDPRYARIGQILSEERLRAACRVAGTHLHLGMSSLEEAIAVHNALVREEQLLFRLGDRSNGERAAQYRLAAGAHPQLTYADPADFFRAAVAHGFADNPRDCWQFIRISRHGTVELRMFDAFDRIDELIDLVQAVTALLGRRRF